MLLFLMACSVGDPAPADIDTLAGYLFANFESAEELSDGLANLYLALDVVDYTADAKARSFTLSPLEESDVEGLNRPNRDPEACDSLGLAHQSLWPLEEHVAYMILDDLVPTSASASIYERSFLEGAGECFVDRSCPVMRTVNTIRRESLFLDIEYELFKDYRWVTLSDGQEAVLARGWIAESAHSDGGASHIYQNHELDVYFSDGSETRRLYVVWTESDYAGIDEATAWNLSLNSTQKAFERLDEWIEENQSL